MKNPNELIEMSERIERFLDDDKDLTESQIKTLLAFIKETKPYVVSNDVLISIAILFNIGIAYISPITEMGTLGLFAFAVSVTSTIYWTAKSAYMRFQIFIMERDLMKELSKFGNKKKG